MKYILVFIILLSFIPIHSESSDDKKNLIQQITKIKEQEGRILQNLKKIERDIKIYEEKISSSEEIIKKLSTEINKLNISIKTHQNQLKEHKTMYFNALRNYYMRRDSSYLTYMFTTTNSKDFLRHAKYVKFIFEKEQHILNQLNSKLSMIKKEEKAFSERKDEIAYHKDKLIFDRKQLSKAKADKQEVLDNIMKKQAELEEKYKTIDKGSQKIESVIKKTETSIAQKDIKSIPVVKQIVPKNNSKPLNSKPSKTTDIAKSNLNKEINFIWPIGDINSVIAFYGKQKNEFNTSYFNTGINIACPQDSIIHASGKGKVMYKGIVEGYGDVIIIDHGNGYTTLYANLADILVGIGEDIKQGEDIAKISNDSKLKMGVLHFELRYQGEPIDPLKKL